MATKHVSKKSKKHSSSSEEEWIEKEMMPSEVKTDKDLKKYATKSPASLDSQKKVIKSAREDWMNLPTSFQTDSHLDRRKQREERRKDERERHQYNPRECDRELNPYWKDNGDGLPKFQKPASHNEYLVNNRSSSFIKKNDQSQSQWRKVREHKNLKIDNQTDKPSTNQSKETEKTKNIEVVTEKELNSLGAKIIKAELMGNTKLSNELKDKLKKARDSLQAKKSHEESIILTHTDTQGRSHPIKLYSPDEGTHHKRKKNLETHKDGNRVKYFADDDKYSLKQLFENEKYSADDGNKEFYNMTKRVRKNDDMDDIFSDNIRKKESQTKMEMKNKNEAISQHNKMSNSLDNCSKCIQSEYMPKHLMVSMGETVYLGLPTHEPLTEGHCLIVPIRHVPCSTQLDENEWCDIRNICKALVRMFSSKCKVAIFFECAISLHKFPHMYIECVPLPKEEGDVAPIYFKKAIDECEMEWSQNKKLISLKNRDVRKAVPKGLPYFSVSFGNEEGYAHVIEDEQLFPKNFAQEIIGGMLDIHHRKWRKPLRQNFEEQSKRVLHFSNIWKDFDCTM